MIQKLIDHFNQILPKIQQTIIIIALASFFISIAIYFASFQNLINLPERFTPATFLSCLAVPLSILLVYELFLLVKATAGSFIGFVIVQFEVISLILLRDLFKRIDELQQDYSLTVITDISIVAVGGIILYFLIEVLERISKHFVEGELKEEIPGKEGKRLRQFKMFLELFLLLFLIVVVIYEVIGYFIGIGNTGLNTNFVQIIFSGLIVYSIAQLLLVLIVNTRYETLFEHSAMVLASVVVLASLESPTYVRVPLVIGSLLFVIATLFLHGFARGKRFGSMLEEVQKKA